MHINVIGDLPESTKTELVDAAEFYAGVLMDPRMVRNISLEIEIDRYLQHEGQCVNDECTKNPRWFTISLRCGENDEDPLRTLAHEIVHLKQYAKNQLDSKHVKSARTGSLVIQNIWEGNVWKPRKNECGYFDSPWELEAFGREVGLYRRWLKLQEMA